MLIVCKPEQNIKSAFKAEWMLLVYIPYLWIFFAKMYHNEIVSYFKKCKESNRDSIVLQFLKLESRIDTIMSWLKMLIFASLLSFGFCAKEYVKSTHGNTILNNEINSLWFVQLVCAWCMLVNCWLTLTCFSYAGQLI